MIELTSEIEVEGLDDKIRLDKFLTEETGWSRSQIKLQLDAGKAIVENRKKQVFWLKIMTKYVFFSRKRY